VQAEILFATRSRCLSDVEKTSNNFLAGADFRKRTMFGGSEIDLQCLLLGTESGFRSAHFNSPT